MHPPLYHASLEARQRLDAWSIENDPVMQEALCQVWVYSGRGAGQVQTKTDEGREQGAGQEVSPAGVGDRVDSTTKDNER